MGSVGLILSRGAVQVSRPTVFNEPRAPASGCAGVTTNRSLTVGMPGKACLILETGRSSPCKLPVQHVAERAQIPAMGWATGEATPRAVTEVNPIRPREENEGGT